MAPQRRPRPARDLAAARGVDRLLALADDGGQDAASDASRLDALRRFVLTWGAVRSFVWLGLDAPLAPALLVATGAVLAAAAALAFAPGREHLGPRLALPALLAQLAAGFPLSPNHFFVELYAVALLALVGRGGRDAPLSLAALRWLAALVLFHTGLQKLLYGHYLHGDFLAFMVGRGGRFADLFAWILPAAEVARLQALNPFQDGAGPYRVSQPLFVALSNAVWLAELLLPVGLLLRRTRRPAAAAALAFVLALQLGARELGFALVFGNLLLAFAPPAWARRALPLSLAVLAATFAAGALGVAPELVAKWHLW